TARDEPPGRSVHGDAGDFRRPVLRPHGTPPVRLRPAGAGALGALLCSARAFCAASGLPVSCPRSAWARLAFAAPRRGRRRRRGRYPRDAGRDAERRKTGVPPRSVATRKVTVNGAENSGAAGAAPPLGAV